MASVESVANQIIDDLGRLTAWKLQKLVFYAQAIHLARHGTPLFNEEVEAFEDGPVVRSLWERFRRRRTLHRGDLLDDTQALAGTAAEAVAEAIMLYGEQSADWLRHQTHIEAPWSEAWERRDDWLLGHTITHEQLIEYYRPVFTDPEIEQALQDAQNDPGMTSEEILEHYADHLS